jgi:hypothetical protein
MKVDPSSGRYRPAGLVHAPVNSSDTVKALSAKLESQLDGQFVNTVKFR